jgi:hypothetical protein
MCNKGLPTDQLPFNYKRDKNGFIELSSPWNNATIGQKKFPDT